jgi:LytR cell envelope-related transcriptional attenuator
MATPPRSQPRDSGARSMSSRTVAVTAVVLALGSYVVYKGLSKPATLSTNGATVTTSKGKPGATTTPTSGAAGATTVPPLVATTLPAPVNAKVDVLVANAAEIQGIAGEMSTVLQKKGYQLAKPGNATPVDASAIYFTSGNDRLAALVAKDLNIPAEAVGALTTTPPGLQNAGAAGVIVILGKTFKKAEVPPASALQAAGGAAPAAAAPAITAATAAPAATTVKPAPAVTTPATTKKP